MNRVREGLVLFDYDQLTSQRVRTHLLSRAVRAAAGVAGSVERAVGVSAGVVVSVTVAVPAGEPSPALQFASPQRG